MHTLWKILLSLFLSFGITLIHFLISAILPSPINYLNIIFTLLALIIIIFKNNLSLSTCFLSVWMLELFTSYPYGINMAAMLLALFLLAYISTNYFSNRSTITIYFISLTAIIIYRIIFIILIWITNFASQTQYPVTWDLAGNLCWEALFTPIAIAIIYWLASKFLRKLNPIYISQPRAGKVGL